MTTETFSNPKATLLEQKLELALSARLPSHPSHRCQRPGCRKRVAVFSPEHLGWGGPMALCWKSYQETKRVRIKKTSPLPVAATPSPGRDLKASVTSDREGPPGQGSREGPKEPAWR